MKNKSLKYLNLKSNKIGDDGMKVIAQALKGVSSKIQVLNLTKTGITHLSFRKICQNIATNHDMLTLIVNKNNLASHYNFKEIINMCQASSTLKELSCSNCHLTDTFGIMFCEALKTNRALAKFNFYGNEMTSRTLIAFASALKESIGCLAEFNMGKNNFNDTGGIKFG